MKKKYFGTDGIRGTFDEFPITIPFFLNLIDSIKKTHSYIKKIIIGKDTRESSEVIESALVKGFINVGVKPDSCGVVSTPILSYYTKKYKYDLGIMISASHNPYNDNGIKIFNKDGEKLSDEDEIKLEKNLTLSEKILDLKNDNNSNRIPTSEYENLLINKFESLTGFKRKVVIDCANGSLFEIAPKIFKSLDLNFINYACKPDGKNINKNCGAMFPQKLSKETLKNKAYLGISFDGDADRVIFSDENGQIIDGDYILAILAIFLKKNNNLDNNLVIGTQMSNLGFRDFLKNNGIKYYLSNVGDRYVIELMKEKKAVLGGEQSGHIIFSNNSYCGDGILTALTILQILKDEKSSLSNLCKSLFKKVPQKLVNFKLNKTPQLILENIKIQSLLKLTSEIKGCDILLRKSGTENLLRLMVQANSKSLVDKIINNFSLNINKLDG